MEITLLDGLNSAKVVKATVSVQFFFLFSEVRNRIGRDLAFFFSRMQEKVSLFGLRIDILH